MTATGRLIRSTLTGFLRAGTAACALLIAVPTGMSPGFAQVIDEFEAPADARMLLTAEELVYNTDREVVTATGGVQIDYAGYNLVAERVEYDQRTGRMRAFGNVEIVEPDGYRVYAEEIDVTDDFADGFVNALKVETPDNTRIAAESAERRGGVETTFNRGVYTACEPCKRNPEKPPFWQVKAERVIRDERTKTIKLEKARFELFGLPIAYLPYLEVPDFDRKRKSGFLAPSFGSDDALGSWLRVPYFLTLGPSADVTVSGTGYTQQGFLLEAEFRKRFDNGLVTLKMAGISQTGQDEFDPRFIDGDYRERGLIGSTGRFQINDRWRFGWNLMVESDPAFARTYDIEGYDGSRYVSDIYLTGLGRRNYFDLRAFKVDRRNSLRVGGEPYADLLEDREARVHPLLDYNKIFNRSVFGGELSLDVNAAAVSREEEFVTDLTGTFPDGTPVPDIYRGLEGENQRATAELEWRRTFTTAAGLRLTPLLAARGDLHNVDTLSNPDPFAIEQGGSARGMVTAGLEASYPILMTAPGSTHVFEPIAQIFVRPDEPLAGGLPNEDAQSFVFDATSLFERDKFSGYDRIEGGTRANVGFRYTGTFQNGVTAEAIFGQSYHLAGQNSFAVYDHAYVAANSGLDQDVSDFVGMTRVSLPFGVTLGASGRFDKDTFELARGDLSAGFTHNRLSGVVTYSDIKAQRDPDEPGYGSDDDRRGITAALSLQFHENWRVFGATGYDLAKERFNTTTVGVTFANECVALTLNYSQEPSYSDTPNDWSVGARLSLRTLGDLDFGSATGESF